jgi:hypothetical protein
MYSHSSLWHMALTASEPLFAAGRSGVMVSLQEWSVSIEFHDTIEQSQARPELFPSSFLIESGSFRFLAVRFFSQ